MMLSYKEVTVEHTFDDEPIIKGVMYNDDVEIIFDGYYEPQSCAMFLYKTRFQGEPVEFCFVGYSLDETTEHRRWIGPVCEVILPFYRIDKDPGEFIQELSPAQKQKIEENVTYAVLHFEQFKGSNPPYPKEIVFAAQAKHVLDMA
jgi:hypothetical protein